MSAAVESPWTLLDAKTELRLLFEKAPVGLVECRRDGNVRALNPVGERMLGAGSRMARPLRLAELIQSEDPAEGERLLRELFDEECHSFNLNSKSPIADGRRLRCTGWRVAGGQR